jgi:hypothetical protein
VEKVHGKSFIGKSFGLLFMVVLLTVFLSPSGETVLAFNQSNLIRVAEIREVDGRFHYTRVAPVSEFLP